MYPIVGSSGKVPSRDAAPDQTGYLCDASLPHPSKLDDERAAADERTNRRCRLICAHQIATIRTFPSTVTQFIRSIQIFRPKLSKPHPVRVPVPTERDLADGSNAAPLFQRRGRRGTARQDRIVDFSQWVVHVPAHAPGGERLHHVGPVR